MTTPNRMAYTILAGVEEKNDMARSLSRIQSGFTAILIRGLG
jgi:hypothetical protein